MWLNHVSEQDPAIRIFIPVTIGRKTLYCISKGRKRRHTLYAPVKRNAQNRQLFRQKGENDYQAFSLLRQWKCQMGLSSGRRRPGWQVFSIANVLKTTEFCTYENLEKRQCGKRDLQIYILCQLGFLHNFGCAVLTFLSCVSYFKLLHKHFSVLLKAATIRFDRCMLLVTWMRQCMLL